MSQLRQTLCDVLLIKVSWFYGWVFAVLKEDIVKVEVLNFVVKFFSLSTGFGQRDVLHHRERSFRNLSVAEIQEALPE